MIIEKHLSPFAVLIVTAVLVLFLPVSTVVYQLDSIWYLQKSIHIYRELEYANVFRGPVFPGLSSSALILTGGDIFALSYVPRLAFLLAALSVFVLTHRLYGTSVAVACLVLFVAAPNIHLVATQFHVDIVVVAFTLAALAVHVEALTRRSVALGVASGITLAVAILTKEVAIVVIPIFALAWLATTSPLRTGATVALASFGATVGAIAPWAFYVYLRTGDLANLLGRNIASSGKFGSYTETIFDSIIVAPYQAFFYLWEFIDYYLIKFGAGESDTIALPLNALILLGATAPFLALLVSRRQKWFFPVLIVGATLPLASYVGYHQYNARQAAIIISLWIVAAGALPRLVLDLSYAIHAKNEIWQRTAKIGAVSVPVLFAAATPAVWEAFTGKQRAFALTSGFHSIMAPSGTFDPVMARLGPWLANRLEAGKGIMTAYPRNAKLLEGFVTTTNPTGVPILKHNLKEWLLEQKGKTPKIGPRQATQAAGKWSEQPGSLLFLWPNMDLNRPETRWNYTDCLSVEYLTRTPEFACKFYFVGHDSLMSKIEEKSVQFVIVGKRFSFMETFFKNSPNFSERRRFDGDENDSSFTVFETSTNMKTQEPLHFPVVSFSMPVFVEAFESQHPELFRTWKEEVFFNLMGSNPNSLNELRAGTLPCFEVDLYDSRSRACLTKK